LCKDEQFIIQEHRNTRKRSFVDIVLNSLTGPRFKEATLAVYNKGASSVEMSKLNAWTIEEINSMRDYAFYKIADIHQRLTKI